ncbi:MAG TPA: 16S rRNA (cytosine(1402)-N(4))-methyltransferase RsmH [Pyrinomonadaceae bacterium]|nr:16S rRNA (cytosine(1402)-N(4))-methyltransferase RsmH [Pyrinomonadaceae bacterium]
MNERENRPEDIHASVLLDETIKVLDPQPDGVFIDATLGLGGHTEAILETAENSRVVGIDQDLKAIAIATERLARFGERVQIVHANFAGIKQVAADVGITAADGVIADLGVSSLQFDSESRGFSFRFDAPLDMRMDSESGGETAADLLERLSEEEIANLIYEYGEERFSRRIARRIVEKREAGEPVRTTKQLANLVEKAVKRSPKDKIHPATRTFQALRIAVNRELEILEQFIADSIDLLKKEGRFVVITFHSLEDRIAKQTLQRLAGKCFCPPRIPKCVCGAAKIVEVLTKKPVTAGDDEVNRNPRARSAKLRACMKL